MRHFILLVSLCLGFSSFAAPESLDKIVAIVNNDVITQNELSFRMDLLKEQTKAAPQSAPPLPGDDVLAPQVLDRMIEQRLVKQAAERGGVVVSDADLQQALASVAKQNKMTIDQLKNSLAQDGIEFKKFEEDLRNQVMISRTQQRLVGSTIKLSDAEIDHWVAQMQNQMSSQQQYLFGHILIALPKDPSPEQLTEAHKKVETVLQKLHQKEDFRQVALSYSDSSDVLERTDLGWRYAHELPTLLTDIAPTVQQGELKGPIRDSSGLHIVQLLDLKENSMQKKWVEESHVRHILVAVNQLRDEQKAHARIDEVVQKLKAGGDFAALAKEYSDDPGSKQSGGDLGFVKPKSLTPKFAQAMKQLPVGQLSEPVLTPFGWHVIEVVEVKKRDATQELLRAEIQEKLYQRKMNEALQNWYTQLRDQAQVQTYL